MTGNGNIPYICYFQVSCFANENTKQSDHAGRAVASYIEYTLTPLINRHNTYYACTYTYAYIHI